MRAATLRKTRRSVSNVANVRLRRELQEIGYLVPVEIEHAIMRSNDCSLDEVKTLLSQEGYSDVEIERGLQYSLAKGFIFRSNEILSISCNRLDSARRLLVIDIVATVGDEISESYDRIWCLNI